MFGQDGVKLVPIGVMTFFLVAILHVFTALTIGKEMMLFKVGEKSENCIFGLNYNRSICWTYCLETRLYSKQLEFSCCFEWDDWFCLYSSYCHWNANI